MMHMTKTGLPEPGIGRNPPRYKKVISTAQGARHLVATVIIAFAMAGGIYYFFAV
jgi:hypothetical protein